MKYLRAFTKIHNCFSCRDKREKPRAKLLEEVTICSCIVNFLIDFYYVLHFMSLHNVSTPRPTVTA